MNNEPDICRNKHGGNEFSDKAHENSDPAKRESMRERILCRIKAMGDNGANCWEIEHHYGFSHQSCSARITELKADGLVHGTGRSRPTGLGGEAEVLVAAKPKFYDFPWMGAKK